MNDNKKGESLNERSRRRTRRVMMIRINLILAAILMLLLIVLLVKSCGSGSDKELLVNTDTFYPGIYVEDISLQGMTMDQAKTAVLDKLEKDCSWDMQVIYGDKVYQVEDILSDNLDEILTEAFQKGRTGDEKQRIQEIKELENKDVFYTVDGSYNEEILNEVIEKAAEEFNTAVKNADLTGYDEAAGEFLYSDSSDGLELDRDDLKSQIQQAIAAKQYAAKLTAKMNVIEPELDRAVVKEKVQLIGRFTTTTTNNSDRNENIRLASGKINNLVIKPGEEFSMNDVTGPRSEADGYKPAGAIVNGKLVEEFGGGVCQVSTTLYNALIESGLETTERFSHSLEPSYVTPGEDAMVSYPGADLKFKNNSKSSVVILFSFESNQLTASLYGIPVLDEGVTIEMRSETTGVIAIPKPEYQEDPSLKYGEEKIITQGREGKKVTTYLVTKKNGVLVSEEFFHTSIYKPKTPVIARNKKAKPEDTLNPDETSGPDQSMKPCGTEKPKATVTPRPTISPTPEPLPTITPTPAPPTEDPEEPSQTPADEPAAIE